MLLSLLHISAIAGLAKYTILKELNIIDNMIEIKGLDKYFKIKLTQTEHGKDFYSGKVVDEETSIVSLTRMRSKLFYGMIITEFSSWHLELVNETMVFYDSRDYTASYNSTCSQGKQMNMNINTLKTKFQSGNLLNSLKKRQQVSNSVNECGMSLYADQSFIKLMGANTQKQMVAGLQLASQIYEAIFNVKLIAKKVTLLNGNYGINRESSIEGLLNTAATELAGRKYGNDDPNQYCLTHIFTNKNFGSTLGLAFKGDGNGAQVGGICDGAVAGSSQALNVGVSTAYLGISNEVLTQIPWITTITHEIGHNFGSSHDEQTTCASSNPTIMSAVVNAQIKSIPDFSACSKNDIKNNMSTKKCFQTVNRFVGKNTTALRNQISQTLVNQNADKLTVKDVPISTKSGGIDTAKIKNMASNSTANAEKPYALKNALNSSPSIAFGLLSRVFVILLLCF